MINSITDSTNILTDLRNLQISAWRNPLRRKHQIMRKLICQESSKFTQVWEEESPKAIYYESNRIYFNDYRKCYASFGCLGTPEVLYDLPRCPKVEKIEDALVCEFNTDKVSTVTEDNRSHLIALSRDNCISLLDLDTGRTIRKIFLSKEYKFRSLAWNSPANSFFVKASVRRSLLNTTNPFTAFIVFETFPLRLHSHITVTKEVFKKSISDSSIFQGLLIVLHPGGLVRLFSYDRTVEKHMSERPSLRGFPSDGIPVTVSLKEMPPILFELRCNEHNLWLGGVPLHYLYQPTNEDSYRVCQLTTEEMIENGSIPVSLDAYETDSLHFMSDDSNRLFHVTALAAKIIKIKNMDDGYSSLEELFKIEPHEDDANRDISDDSDDSPRQTWLMSSRGRVIKRSIYLDESLGIVSSRIHSIQYDNDLRVIVATSLTAEQQSGGSINAYVCFHDEDSGRTLKSIELDEPWDDTYEHTVAFDLDTLVHVYKDSGVYRCALYRLDRSMAEEDESEKRPKR